MKWSFPVKEILISIFSDGSVSLIPVDMEGITHHSTSPIEKADAIVVYYGSVTSHIENGSICIRGYRLVVDVDVVIGRLKCLVVKVSDTSEDEYEN
jgi:hypothetical protein